MTTCVEVDLHEAPLYEAEVLICERLEEAWFSGKHSICFIHGYRGGNAIRNFIWSRLSSRLKRNYPELPAVELRSQGRGATVVLFK